MFAIGNQTLFLALESKLLVILTPNFGERPNLFSFSCSLPTRQSFKIQKIVAREIG